LPDRDDARVAGGQPEEQQRYDRFTPTQALSRRGYVLWAVVPFVIAALGFTAVSIVSHDGGGSGFTVQLPISGGAADTGSAGDQQVAGQLETDTQHCVYLRPSSASGSSGGGSQVWAVWPIGYSAVLDGSHLAVTDRHGNEVAQSGQLVTISGAYASAKDYATEPCLPKDGQVFVIDSPVTAVGQ
jgi:hypothetical protein